MLMIMLAAGIARMFGEEPMPGLQYKNGIESSYISGYMLRQMDMGNKLEAGSFEISGEITDMYVYRSAFGSEMIQELRLYLSENPGLKLLMRSTSETAAVSIYGRKSSRGKDGFCELVIWNNTLQGCELVVIFAEEGINARKTSFNNTQIVRTLNGIQALLRQEQAAGAGGWPWQRQ